MADFSRALNCSTQVAAASKADVIVQGIPKVPHHTVIYKQAADIRERDTQRERCQRSHMEGKTTDKDESPSKLKVKEYRHRENILLLRMWSNVRAVEPFGTLFYCPG